MEKWSMGFSFDLNYNSPNYPKFIDFEAENDSDAKLKVLNICKKIVSRMRHSKWKYFMINAAPYIESGDVLDGNRMIRIKIWYSNRRILRIKNPDKSLVQGYGSKALNKLHKY